MRLLCLFALWGAVEAGVEIVSRPTTLYHSITPKLRIQGEGFGDEGTALRVKLVPYLSESAYTVVVSSRSSFSILLKTGYTWPIPSEEVGESTMYITSVQYVSVPDVELLATPVAVATILGTPSIVKRDDRLVYMTGSIKLVINGSWFRARSTDFTFDPPLYKDVDYVQTVRGTGSDTSAQLVLKTGRAWRSDGAPGPLKIKRLDTGAGVLRVDALYGGVTVAEVQANLGAHGVTVETTSDKRVYQSSPTLTILGQGFNASGTNVLRWGNSLRGLGLNYTISKAEANELTLTLTPGSKWRANAANLPDSLTLLAIDAGAGLVPVGATEAKKGRVVATVYANPSLKAATRALFRTLTHEIWVEGAGFVRGQTSFALLGTSADGAPLLDLRPFVDYVMVVFNSTHARVSLRDGKAWANGAGGELRCVGLDTGAGQSSAASAAKPFVLASIAEDAVHESGAAVTRTAMTQTIYETPELKKLTIAGENLCGSSSSVDKTKLELTFNPPVDFSTYSVSSASSSKITLSLKKGERWPVGAMYLAKLKCDPSAKEVTFADGAGVGIATVLADPTIDAHPELVLYAEHSKRVVIRGSGFSPEGTELTLVPTLRSAYKIVECLEESISLELLPGERWTSLASLSAAGAKGLPLRVVKIDTGAGEVSFATDNDGGVVAATLVNEPDGDVCDDSCEWANDGYCDDGTAPLGGNMDDYEDDYAEGGRKNTWDDDYGGNWYDDDYYGGFYDDEYGAYFDDANDLPACLPGTDCTDCQPRGGDAQKFEQVEVECDNSCQYSRDGYCDDTRVSSYCALGTDCQDCGPASAGNYTLYDDDGWWDDDEENWYWDDDYYEGTGAEQHGDDDDYFYYDDAATSWDDDDAYDDASLAAAKNASAATKPASDDDDKSVVGFVRSSPNPFEINDDAISHSSADGATSLLVAGAVAAALSVAACAALRVATRGTGGGFLPLFKGGKAEGKDLAAGWAEMSDRKAAKAATVPITPDVSFSGGRD